MPTRWIALLAGSADKAESKLALKQLNCATLLFLMTPERAKAMLLQTSRSPRK